MKLPLGFSQREFHPKLNSSRSPWMLCVCIHTNHPAGKWADDNIRPGAEVFYFCSSFILLTLLDWHLGQARSTIGALGSKGILNSCPHLKHLKVASSAMLSPIKNAK